MDNRKGCEKEFDSFINKIIIFSSKEYFRKQMKYGNNERYIIDNEDYCDYLESHTLSNVYDSQIERAELSMLLQNALSCLSDLEQAAFIMSYKLGLNSKEVSKRLKIHEKSLSRLKRRSEEKLRKYLGDEGEL